MARGFARATHVSVHARGTSRRKEEVGAPQPLLTHHTRPAYLNTSEILFNWLNIYNKMLVLLGTYRRNMAA